MRAAAPAIATTLAAALCAGCTGHATAAQDDGDPPDTDGTAEDTDDVGFPPDTDTDVDLVDGDWVIGQEVACADPSQRAAAPLVPLDGGSAWRDQSFDAASDAVFVAGGVAVGDLTGDGRPDLLVTSAEDVPLGYWVQGPDLTFTDAGDRLPAGLDRAGGVTLVDVDDDGDLDAFVARFRASDALLRNDGTGTFTDATDAAGLAGPARRRSMSSSWADIDGDGDLDAFVAGYGALNSGDGGGLPPGDGSSIFVNQGDGTFVDDLPRYAEPHVLREAHTFAGAFVDADLDGDQDLYLVNDFGWVHPSMFLRNDAGFFTPVTGVGATLARENMGLGLGDLNGDQRPDLLVAAWDTRALFVSREGQWFDEADARALDFDLRGGQRTAWGADLADLDNDGDLDAYVVFGHIPVQSSHENPEEQRDALWLQEDDGTFTEVAAAWGLDDPARQRGFVLVDLDRNGFLDVVRPDLRGPTDILMARCDASAWLEVSLSQPAPNRSALGARVVVLDGDTVWTRDVRAGGTSYGSSGPPEVHVGLGDRDVVDRVEIHWPDGTVSARDAVPTRRRLVVSHP